MTAVLSHSESCALPDVGRAASVHQQALAARRRGDRLGALTLLDEALDLQPGSIAMLADMGQELIALGRFEDARRCFEEALAATPDAIPALRGMANLARRQGDRKATLAYLDQIVALDPANVWSLADRAAELRETGALDEAEAAYRDILQRDPKFFQGYRGLGHIERRRGRRTSALEQFERALECAPTDIWVLHEVATELYELGRVEDAEAKCRRILDLNSHFIHAHRLLAQMARRHGDRARQLCHLRDALAGQPDDVSSLVDLAAALREDRQFDEAEALYQRAVHIDPRFVAAQRGLGLIARHRGRHDDALAFFQHACDLAPQDLWCLFELGMQYRVLRKSTEAQSAFTAALQIDPQFHQARLWRARVRFDAGDRDGAQADVQASLAAEVADSPLRTDVACVLRDLDQTDAAERVFQSVLDETPNHGPALRGYAQLLRRADRHEEACALFEKLVGVEGATDATIADLAAALSTLDKREEARRCLDEFLAHQPRSPRCLVAYAQTMAGEIAHGERLALLQRAADAGADLPDVRCTLAREHLANGRPDLADVIFAEVLERHPAQDAALMGRALAARALGQSDEALAHLRTAVAVNPASEGAVVELARELLRRGDLQEALATLDQGMSRHPRSLALTLERGLFHRRTGDHAAARAIFAEAARSFPESLQAQFETAVCARQAGDLDQALDCLLTLLDQDPRHIPALAMLGGICEQFDDLETAALFYDRCMALAPQVPGPALQKARCIARLGRLPEALALLADLARRLGPLPDIALTEGALRKGAGDLRRAQTILMQALLFHPNHMQLWSTLAQLCIDLGEFAFVERLLDQVPVHGAQDAWHIPFVQGMLAMARWNVDAAYDAFVRVTELHASPHWEHEWAARAALLKVDVDATLDHLERSVALNGTHLVAHAGQPRPSQTFIGQLADEYRLNPDLCRRLRTLIEAGEPLDDLAALVRETPDYTPTAISYLVAMQKTGRLQRIPATHAALIPKSIVQFWYGVAPADVDEHCRTWSHFNPSHAYHRFSDAEARAFLADHFTEKILEAYLLAREPAKKADLFRLAYLSLRGGIYVDCDDVCTAPVSTLIPPGATLVLYHEDLGTIGNNFIAAVPRHPVICEALRAAADSVLRGDTDILFLSTGPGQITRSLATWLAEAAPSAATGLMVHTRPSLFAGAAIHCAASYKHTDNHWSRTAFGRSRQDLQDLVARVAPYSQARHRSASPSA